MTTRDRFRIGAAMATAVVGLLFWQQVSMGPLKEADRVVTQPLLPGDGELLPRPDGDFSWRRERVGRPEDLAATRLLVLDEDPEGYFESVPPPPADLAVVFARLRRAGLEVAGLGLPLEWENPDLLAVAALRSVLDDFEVAVLGFALRDSTAAGAVARPFLAASLSVGEVEGNVGRLPVVNAIRGSAPELGGARSLAGFTRLESEQEEAGRAFLLARWEDRVVLALPLVVEMKRRGLEPDDLRIAIGDELRLGAKGPRIAIDRRGRCKLPESADTRSAPLSAVISESLPDGFAGPEQPIFTVDGRPLMAGSELEWSARLPRVDTAIRGAPQVDGEVSLVRPLCRFEGPALGAAALALGWALSGFRGWRRWLAAALLSALFAVGVAGASSHGVPTVLAWLALPFWAALASALTWLAPDDSRRAGPFESSHGSRAD